MTERRIEVELRIAGHAWEARAARVEEGMSEPGGAWVEIAVGDDLDVEPLLEEEAILSIKWELAPVRRHTMRLSRARFLGERDGHLRYELELRPAFWLTRLDHGLRKFRDQTTQAIVSKMLDGAGVAHAWHTTRKSGSRPYCVQYRETTFAFVSRLLEWEGFYYTFDPDGTMVIGDTSSSSPAVPGKPVYTLAEAAGALAHGDFGITEVERGAAIGSGKATVNDHDWKKPAVSLLQSASGPRDAALEVYDYPVGYRDPGVGATLAKLRLEAYEAEKKFVDGKGTVPGFAPAHVFELLHDEAVSFSGKWMLVRVEHVFRTGEDGAITYANAWRAIPASVPFRPPLVTPRPVIAGNHTAMVRGPEGEEIHTDAYGRAKVQFHWDREATGTDEDSRWIRTLQETSTSIALSRVGWEISVGYIDGDPDRPVGLARQINGVMTPQYAQPANKHRMTIRSESYPGKAGYNELRMEDSVSVMSMDWHAQKDLKTLVQNDRIETVGNDSTVLVTKGSERTVAKNQSIEVGSDETRSVMGSLVAKVEKDRTHAISGSEKISVKKDNDVSVEGNDTEVVGSLRFTKTGSFGVSIPSPKELLHGLVASAGDSVGGALSGAIGDKLGGVVSSLAGGSGLKGAMSAATGASAQQAGAALASGGGLAGAGKALASGFSGTGNFAGLGSALKGAVPSAQGLLGSATGGLTNIRSVADLAMFLHGSIDRSTHVQFTRMVGGAQISLAGGVIAHDAGILLVEAVGGAKLTVAAKEGIQQGVNGWMLTTVGGAILKKSKGDMSVSAKKSSVRVGGVASFTSDERVELRGKTIDVVAQQKLTLDGGGITIEMTPGATKVTGKIRLDAADKIKVRGNPDRLAT